jgi:branched-subunit amino acid ABC-type transport system permease component
MRAAAMLAVLHKRRNAMQTLVFGLTFGGIYALMALAINVIYSTTRIMNFAHAISITWAAMFMYYLYTICGVSFVPAVLSALVVNMVVNLIIYNICVEKIGDLNKNSNWVISLFGISHIIEAVLSAFRRLVAAADRYQPITRIFDFYRKPARRIERVHVRAVCNRPLQRQYTVCAA